MSPAGEVATVEYDQDIFDKPTWRILAWSRTPEAQAAVAKITATKFKPNLYYLTL